MNNTSKKNFIVGAAVLVIGISGIANLARAKSNGSQDNSGRGNSLSRGESVMNRDNHDQNNQNEVNNPNEHQGRNEHRNQNRHVTGTVVSVDGSTLVLTRGSKTFTVKTTGDTAFVNRKGDSIDKGDIKVGDRVTARGTVIGLVVDPTASVRDRSLPI